MTSLHDQLVARAVTWLTNSKRCVCVISEMATANRETPDAIGWLVGGETTLVECKASRADFLADRAKFFRRDPASGMGNRRYFLVYPGVVNADDDLRGWGLLELRTRRAIREVCGSADFDANRVCEATMLLSALRRKRADGVVAVRWYQWLSPSGRARVVLPAEPGGNSVSDNREA